jgi:hypothetical protein
MNRIEYIKALRELADYVESREFPDEWKGWWSDNKNSFANPALEFSTYQKSDFGKIAKAMGTFKKEVTDYSTMAHVSLPSGATVKVTASRDVVCRKVEVGTKIIPAKEEEVIPAEPEREEPIYKWECPESFVDLANEETTNAG